MPPADWGVLRTMRVGGECWAIFNHIIIKEQESIKFLPLHSPSASVIRYNWQRRDIDVQSSQSSVCGQSSVKHMRSVVCRAFALERSIIGIVGCWVLILCMVPVRESVVCGHDACCCRRSMNRIVRETAVFVVACCGRCWLLCTHVVGTCRCCNIFWILHTVWYKTSTVEIT